jgi:hypothetical protein
MLKNKTEIEPRRQNKPERIEQVRKRGLPPLVEFKQRGQAPLPDVFYSELFYF